MGPEIATHVPAGEVSREMLAIFWREGVTPHWSTALGACLALYVFSRQLSERRPPGNIMAWGLLVLAFPVVGLVLFILFGARKREEMGRIRKAVSHAAGLARANTAPPHPSDVDETAPIPGNRVTLLADSGGTATFEALRARILGAHDHIHILTYIFGDDPTGRELLELLTGRAKAGVKVRLLVDALGARDAPDAMFEKLVEAGGEFARFMPVAPWKARSSANLRNHRKLAVFDGKSAIVGGQNLAVEYMGPVAHAGRFRDFGALVEGPACAAFNRIFASDWCFVTGEAPDLLRYDLSVSPDAAGDTPVEVVGGGPDFTNDPIWEKLVTLAADCRRELLIVTPYLVPDEVLLRLIAAKARAGRKVRIITPRRSDHRFLDFARRHHLRILRDAGAEILFHDRGMLHGKLFLVDGEVGVFGSANLDMRSLFVNFELATVVRDPQVVGEMGKLADELAGESKPFGRPRNRAVSARERFLEHLAHLLAPLL